MTVPAHPSLQPHQLSDGRGLHHELLVAIEKQQEASEVGVFVVRQLLLLEELRYHGLHLPEGGREAGLLSPDGGQAYPRGGPSSSQPQLLYALFHDALEELGACRIPASPRPGRQGQGGQTSPQHPPRAPSYMAVLLATAGTNHGSLSSTYCAPNISDPFLHFMRQGCGYKQRLLLICPERLRLRDGQWTCWVAWLIRNPHVSDRKSTVLLVPQAALPGDF